ncbi:curved DNA-binding protein [Acinetobacter baylyi]|uniref:Curved DNA-binding protein n=1 Tax=Acinetobacter baylyi TaxID=202950 RepID=A0ABU0UYG5_ACIBI|nr:DnaJ C-terminal domain-containing protein [Acinetobacter baylyi]MDQ1209602.1 curved DNA-binding protein [Acinetobacter baylyi]MDR6106803.1 curved DNA-binding protein [Acinetobacter baylyi]MDR6186473.1 curved DNA-binding protein [Acinetobacter baylyi]
MAQNYYEELGVTRDATPDEIKKSYRKLARKYHPDVSKEADAEAKMQAINVAYDTLSNPEKKTEYDQMLDHPQGFSGFGQGTQGGAGFDGGQFYQQGHASDFSGFEDLFGRFGAGFGGSNQQYQRQTRSYRGEDQHASIEVDLEVAYHGTTQNLTLQIPTLNAYGEPEVQRKTLQVKIPKGMKEGQQIRLNGQGQAGINGGENGDLYIEIQYKDTDRIHVEGVDVYYTIDVAPWEAALGKNIEVMTPSGRLNVNLPKNARTGQQLRLKDKGIPNKTPGNLYLVLNIVLPEAQTEQQQQAYETLAQAFASFKPRG